MDATKRAQMIKDLDSKIADQKASNIKNYHRIDAQQKAEAEHQRLLRTSPAYRNAELAKNREQARKLAEAFNFFRPAKPTQFHITEFTGRTIYYDQKLLSTIQEIITAHKAYSRHPELGAAASGIITDLRQRYNYRFPGRNPQANLIKIVENHPELFTYTRERTIYADYINNVENS